MMWSLLSLLALMWCRDTYLLVSLPDWHLPRFQQNIPRMVRWASIIDPRFKVSNPYGSSTKFKSMRMLCLGLAWRMNRKKHELSKCRYPLAGVEHIFNQPLKKVVLSKDRRERRGFADERWRRPSNNGFMANITSIPCSLWRLGWS